MSNRNHFEPDESIARRVDDPDFTRPRKRRRSESGCAHPIEYEDYEDIVCTVCGRVAGQIQLEKHRGRPIVFWAMRVTDMWGTRTMECWVRPLTAGFHRDWAIDRVREIRTCCNMLECRPCYWCGWRELDHRGRGMCIAGRIGRPLCRWCYDWHHSDYTDNRPYRPHLVERTAHRLDRLLPRTAGGTQMPFYVQWNIAEYLVSMWEP